MSTVREDSAASNLAPTIDWLSKSPQETRRIGARLGALVQPGDVIALQGELGAGKTHFVQGLGKGLGLRDSVHSPTFILANEYRGGRLILYHVDAYRVADAGEAIGFGLDDYLGGDGVTVIEWAERVSPALPPESLWIGFEYAGENERRIRMTSHGERYRLLLAGLRASMGQDDVVGN